MKKTLAAVLAAATLAGAALSGSTPAEARWRGGGAVAAGVIGGIAAGALIAGAARPYYGPGPGYYYAPPPAPVYGPPCYWQQQRFWDGYRWRFRNVRVCY